MSIIKKSHFVAGVILLVLGFVGIMFSIQIPQFALGDVGVGDQTEATTTPYVADRTNLCPAGYTASSTTGTFDFINFEGLSTGDIAIFDATTTNVNLRTGNTATTSLILAWFPAGTGTSTNKFGVAFKRGLLVDYGSSVGTTTIGYRCGS